MGVIKDIWHGTDRCIKRIEAVRPFSDGEAWWLFRAAAWAEAFGWTLLGIAVAARHFGWSWQSYAIPIAGRIHGTFFIAYFVISLAVYTSLRWPRRKFMLAIMAGILPYGTAIFERIVAWQYRTTHLYGLLWRAIYFRLVSLESKAYTTRQ